MLGNEFLFVEFHDIILDYSSVSGGSSYVVMKT